MKRAMSVIAILYALGSGLATGQGKTGDVPSGHRANGGVLSDFTVQANDLRLRFVMAFGFKMSDRETVPATMFWFSLARSPASGCSATSWPS